MKKSIDVKIDDTTAFGCRHHNHSYHRVYIDGLDYESAKKFRVEFQAVVDADAEKANLYVPYQKCPLCDGVGDDRWMKQGVSSSLADPCTVCKGAKIIPMHLVAEKEASYV